MNAMLDLVRRRLRGGRAPAVASGPSPRRGPRGKARRSSLLYRTLPIDIVFDVGANRGQFGERLRGDGYAGRLVSFEPMAGPAAAAQELAAGDADWTVLHHGLGTEDTEAVIHVSGHSGSSSLLTMLPSHERASPSSGTVGTETIRLLRFDHLAPELAEAGEHPAMKIDTQGYELAVLEGAGDRLQRMELLQIELSLVPLYQDGPLYEEVLAFVVRAGYRLAGITPGFTDPASGQLLQMDGIFVRRDLLPVPRA
jgi:FkbM family methyltransferase